MKCILQVGEKSANKTQAGGGGSRELWLIRNAIQAYVHAYPIPTSHCGFILTNTLWFSGGNP